MTVRLIGFPDPILIDTMEKIIAENEVLDSSHWDNRPEYGWDQPEIHSPIEAEADTQQTAYKILFMGDSLTRGTNLSKDEEPYPALLRKALSNANKIHLINASVKAFGIDQMTLKLENIVSTYKPDLVILAYIPDDLWRAGRNVHWGYTKPVLVNIDESGWGILPALGMDQFYRDYVQADRWLYKGLWSLQHIFKNSRYYFPGFHAQYYNDLFRAIRKRLIALSENYDMQIIIVRLASTWPGKAIPPIDDIAKYTFSPPSDGEKYLYLDTQECVESKAEERGINYDEEFRWHPGKIGHEIYASCLIDTVRKAINKAVYRSRKKF